MSEPPDWVPPVRTCALCHAVTSGDDPDFPSPSDSPTFAPYEGAHRLREGRPPACLVCATCHRSFEPA